MSKLLSSKFVDGKPFNSVPFLSTLGLVTVWCHIFVTYKRWFCMKGFTTYLIQFELQNLLLKKKSSDGSPNF